jgi:hypothetical protein
VDANSLTFGATGNEKSLYRCQKQGVDINGDRHPDIICFFNPEIANFHTGDRNGILKGKTKSGQQIEGRAALKLFTMRLEKRGFKHQARHDVRRKRQGQPEEIVLSVCCDVPCPACAGLFFRRPGVND